MSARRFVYWYVVVVAAMAGTAAAVLALSAIANLAGAYAPAIVYGMLAAVVIAACLAAERER